jgi:transglutaminase-like putative cysteine protease
MMKLNIEHRTSYTFSKPVGYTIQELRLTPQDGFGQRVNNWHVKVSGGALSYTDAYGNISHTLVMDAPHQEIVITASGEVETDIDLPPNSDNLALPVYLRNTVLTQPDEKIRAFASSFVSQGTTVDKIVLMAMMHDLVQRVLFVKTTESVEESSQSAIASLIAGKASSQGLAHLFIACCRTLKVPARFVHGYCYNPITNQIESHSWADAWLIDRGWQSFDVANNTKSNGIHVRLATGLDYRDACPISSAMSHAESSTSFRVLVHSMEQSQQ